MQHKGLFCIIQSLRLCFTKESVWNTRYISVSYRVYILCFTKDTVCDPRHLCVPYRVYILHFTKDSFCDTRYISVSYRVYILYFTKTVCVTQGTYLCHTGFTFYVLPGYSVFCIYSQLSCNHTHRVYILYFLLWNVKGMLPFHQKKVYHCIYIMCSPTGFIVYILPWHCPSVNGIAGGDMGGTKYLLG